MVYYVALRVSNKYNFNIDELVEDLKNKGYDAYKANPENKLTCTIKVTAPNNLFDLGLYIGNTYRHELMRFDITQVEPLK